MADIGTVAASVGASSVVAAGVTGVWARLNERKRQLREQSLIVAGDFAGGAMEVLAQLRYYRPTKHRGHRNEPLHADKDLVRARHEAVSSSLDRLRPMRGRVWMFFPGRSGRETLGDLGPQTTADWGEAVVGRLQRTQIVCEDFWRDCDTDAEKRRAQEGTATMAYRAARDEAWVAIDRFAATAASRV